MMDIKNNKSLNVLIVHNYYQLYGGEDSVVKNEKSMLETHGHNVVFYSRNNLEIKGLNLINKLKLPLDLIFNFNSFITVKKIIRDNKIDIVHVHNIFGMISPSVYYAACSCNVPVIQTLHNFRILCLGAAFYRDGHICEDCVEKGLMCAVKHNCYRTSKIQTFACALSAYFHRMTGIYKKINYICLTDFNKQKLIGFKQIRERNVYVKPNFIKGDIEIVPAEKRTRQFIFAGRLEKLKGIDILLKAWEELGMSAPKLIIFGTGSMEDWCREFIEENSINAEMKGFVSSTEIIGVIAKSKALILPTRWYEGFPMSIIEAYSVGTPVICPDMGNCGNIVSEGKTGCKFEPESVSGLIQAIRRIGEYDDIYKSTKKEYSEKYTEVINYNCLMEIYSDILKNKID